MARFLNTTVAKKFAMGISGLFLVLFLILHVTVNLTSVFSADVFNELSRFMGYNFIVQVFLQPILIIGVVFHFVMAFVLETKNRKARPIKYVKYNQHNNTTWMSRNMIYTGGVVLLFLILHLYDFWGPEMIHKFGEGYTFTGADDASRFYPALVAKFSDLWRVILYVIAFVFLMLHLLHGFYGSFQSVGWGNKHSKAWLGFTKWFSVVVPVLFIFIALFHFFSTL